MLDVLDVLDVPDVLDVFGMFDIGLCVTTWRPLGHVRGVFPQALDGPLPDLDSVAHHALQCAMNNAMIPISARGAR
ncbi:hypothetical protein ADL29_31170 [Streptomyces chattanoogensis]|uniref:Uncharacterized protein n=1 Tax=Streptomyces chattanoogensis TaxID=66876 RepID=A0A0N0GWI8_9ACTN|nr:hypothetical protein ADL29_31170 [Streptomyces chattanoogensis]